MRLLQDALESPDPRQALGQRKEEIDMLFLLIVGRALAAAEKYGDSKETHQLQAVYKAALDIIQEGLPPELRLVNELLAADYPEKTQELLEQHLSDLDDAFLKVLSSLATDMESQQRSQIAQRLGAIRTQAEAIRQQSSEGGNTQ